MAEIEYLERDQRDLDLIRGLWEKLNEHHSNHSYHFSWHFDHMNFAKRKQDLLKKAQNGTLRIDLARNSETGEYVGFCVSTVSNDEQGEVESIYIEPEYRRTGIGHTMIQEALAWMDALSVTKKIVDVVFGNEEAYPFYQRFGFYLRVTTMEQIETGE